MVIGQVWSKTEAKAQRCMADVQRWTIALERRGIITVSLCMKLINRYKLTDKVWNGCFDLLQLRASTDALIELGTATQPNQNHKSDT